MPKCKVSGTEIYYEVTGEGFPLVFSHEFASDMRAWEPQVRRMARRYRVITYNNRGYPPSGVPEDREAYSHDLLIDDLRRLLLHVGAEKAHVVGLATGGNVALNFAIQHPEMTRAVVVAGAGAGTVDRERWLQGAQALSDAIAEKGMEGLVSNIEAAPQRQALRVKDPRAWNEFLAQMRDFSPVGASLLMGNALMNRRPIFELEEQIAKLPMPVLVAVGDQDAPAFESSVFIARKAPHGALAVLPWTGHTLNTEEPELFNDLIDSFFAAVDSGRWGSWRG